MNAELQGMMNTFDVDGDGKIQKSEWLGKMGEIFDAAVTAGLEAKAAGQWSQSLRNKRGGSHWVRFYTRFLCNKVKASPDFTKQTKWIN